VYLLISPTTKLVYITTLPQVLVIEKQVYLLYTLPSKPLYRCLFCVRLYDQTTQLRIFMLKTADKPVELCIP